MVVIACRSLEAMLRVLLPPDVPATFLGYELHAQPRTMGAALQAQLDALTRPSLVLLGYGLCGNGVVGVRSGAHVLVMPRTHDCIPIHLGSIEAHAQRFRRDPATWYLTRGWLDSGDTPLHEHRRYVRDYGEDTADELIAMLYRHYRRLRFVASSPQDLTDRRLQLDEVARFCRERLHMQYETVEGGDALVRRLVQASGQVRGADDAMLVLPPGSVVSAAMFHRPDAFY